MTRSQDTAAWGLLPYGRLSRLLKREMNRSCGTEPRSHLGEAASARSMVSQSMELVMRNGTS